MAEPAERAYQPLVRTLKMLFYCFTETAQNSHGLSSKPCSEEGGVKQRKRSREGPEEGPHPSKRLRTSAGLQAPHVEVVAEDLSETREDSGVTESSSGYLYNVSPLSGSSSLEGDESSTHGVIYISSSTQTCLNTCSTAERKRSREGPEEGSTPSKRLRTSAGPQAPQAPHVEVVARPGVSTEAHDVSGCQDSTRPSIGSRLSGGHESSHHSSTPICPCAQTRLNIVSTADFEAHYVQLQPLGKGGYGSVFAGYQKKDLRPVAIKHIPMDKVTMILVDRNGTLEIYPLEVFLMLKAGEGQTNSEAPGAVVLLLDWFQVDQELILVQERPEASVDLLTYMKSKGRKLPEQEAKMILHQVVKGIVALHSKEVLHRDIKPENLLVETGSATPRVRIIDLGCGCPLEDGSYSQYNGTVTYVPPEWLDRGSYRADPMTVWQMGVLLFEMLTGDVPFRTKAETVQKEYPRIESEISPNCQDFLKRCLNKRALGRPALECLLHHPWLHI